jgi:hypothetical protein
VLVDALVAQATLMLSFCGFVVHSLSEPATGERSRRGRSPIFVLPIHNGLMAAAHLLPDPLRPGVSQQQVVGNFPGPLSAINRLTQYPAWRWAFRGRPVMRWGLQPSIERLALPDGSTRRSAERFIRREFKRLNDAAAAPSPSDPAHLRS